MLSTLALTLQFKLGMGCSVRPSCLSLEAGAAAIHRSDSMHSLPAQPPSSVTLYRSANKVFVVACCGRAGGLWASAPGGDGMTYLTSGTLVTTLCTNCAANKLLNDVQSPARAFGRVCEVEWVCPAGHSCAGSVQSLCDAGKYSVLGAETCLSCPPGTSSAAGAPSCTPCPPSTYSTTVNVSTCIACPANTYAPDPGAFRCLPACPIFSELTVR
jgi:hypothetical protein